MITIPLLLLLWLIAVIQSLCGVLGETIGVVRLGRLGNMLALEAKVKSVDFILYRSPLAQVGLGFGRFQLARGGLISWLSLGRLGTAIQLHIVQMFVDGLLTFMCGRTVKVGHGSFYLVLAIHGARRIMVIVVIDTSQTLVLIRMVIPWLLMMSEIVLVSRSVGKMSSLGDTCFVGNVGNRNNGRTMACGHTAQLRRFLTMGVASDLSIERGEEGAFAAIDRVTGRRTRRGRIGRAECRKRSELCRSLLWCGTDGVALVSGLWWTGVSASRPWILEVGLWRVMRL